MERVVVVGLGGIGGALQEPGGADVAVRERLSPREAQQRPVGEHRYRAHAVAVQTGAESLKLKVLSMGMTDDFEVAIEEGANMVRLGRAIFDN